MSILLTPFMRVVTSLVLLTLSFAIPCAAQSNEESDKKESKNKPKPYALIFGTVWAPDNRPVYGVKVKCRRASEKKSRWEAYSDHSGEFAFRVPAGKVDYVVWADMKGVKSLNGNKLQAAPEVTVHIENDERQDIGVHLRY